MFGYDITPIEVQYLCSAEKQGLLVGVGRSVLLECTQIRSRGPVSFTLGFSRAIDHCDIVATSGLTKITSLARVPLLACIFLVEQAKVRNMALY
jgi:hypothetical protein